MQMHMKVLIISRTRDSSGFSFFGSLLEYTTTNRFMCRQYMDSPMIFSVTPRLNGCL